MRSIVALLALAPAVCGQCLSFSNFQRVGTLSSSVPPLGSLWEVSGVEASRLNPDVLWVHDDRGHGPYLFAILANGLVRRGYVLNGVGNVDWEDIAIGPGPVPGREYLYIGDIGDNWASSGYLTILRVAEPDVPAGLTTQIDVLNGVESFACQYPSGFAHDAETLLIDPVDGRPYVLTKESFGSTAYLYGYPMPLDAGVTKTMVLEATFAHAAPTFSGGDVSPDGRQVYVRNQDTIYAYTRADGAAFATAFAGAPCTQRANNQGNAEALTLRPDGSTLIAISEGQGSGIYRSPGSLPSGRAAVPSWWTFGSGLDGANGVPGLGLVAAPVLGQNTLTFGGWGAPSSAPGLLLLSTTFYLDGQVPLLGGSLHAAADSLLPLSYSAGGEVQVVLGVVPDLAVLYGLELHAQAIVLDGNAVQGASLTRGLTMQFDR